MSEARYEQTPADDDTERIERERWDAAGEEPESMPDRQEARSAAQERRDRRLVISLDQEAADHWIVDVAIDGEWVGDGTAPTASGALDVAMSVLYGDTNDHLSGDDGAIRALRNLSLHPERRTA